MLAQSKTLKLWNYFQRTEWRTQSTYLLHWIWRSIRKIWACETNLDLMWEGVILRCLNLLIELYNKQKGFMKKYFEKKYPIKQSEAWFKAARFYKYYLKKVLTNFSKIAKLVELYYPKAERHLEYPMNTKSSWLQKQPTIFKHVKGILHC